jgi:hypothetical protein
VPPHNDIWEVGILTARPYRASHRTRCASNPGHFK